MELTLEQELAIAVFKSEIANLSEEQTKAMLVETFTSLIYMDLHYKELIKEKWGMGESCLDSLG